MITIIFFIIAAFFCSVMDSVDNGHYWDTIFSRWDPNFWYKERSWDKAVKIFGWKFDCWHIAKSMMIIFILLTIINYTPFVFYFDKLLYNKIAEIFILGCSWNIIFNIFYNKFFKIR